MLIIVPARKGSKGIAGKNTKPFCGHPLIDWSFAAAQRIAADLGARIVCTTDDPEILMRDQSDIRMHNRAAGLASDTAGMAGVVLDVCDTFSASRYVLLQPTTPLRLIMDLDALVRATLAHDTVVSCTHPAEHPEDIITLEDQRAHPAIAAPKSTRRQDRVAEYRFVDGGYYAGSVETLLATKSFLPEDTFYQTLSIPAGVDIDTPYDWAMAVATHDWLAAEGYDFVHPQR
ncbi:acylneuraminate cytidylyltransferase family protein [Profundibacter sp.]